MPFNADSLTPEKLHRYRKAAEAAYGDDTRHENYIGHPNRAVGQCYVASAWLTKHEGGGVGTIHGHHFWVSPDRTHVIDLTGDHFDPPGPTMYKRADHPMFKGFRMVGQPHEDAARRAQVFAQRADHALHHGSTKTALDLMGDPYPGEGSDHDMQMFNEGPFPMLHDEPDYQPDPTPQTHQFAWVNGQLRISPIDDHDQLLRQAGAEPDEDGPTAVGYADVANGHVTWRVASNVGLQSLRDVLLHYSKQIGWKFDGLTGLKGESLGMGLGPVVSYYWREKDGQAQVAKTPFRVAREIQVTGSTAYADKLHPGLVDWAGDMGLSLKQINAAAGQGTSGTSFVQEAPTGMSDYNYYYSLANPKCRFCYGEGSIYDPRSERDLACPKCVHPQLMNRVAEYPGGGNLLDHMRVREDLEQYNNGDPNFRPEFLNADAEPSGPFVCKECGAKPDTFAAFKLHMDGHEPKGDVVEDGHFPGLPLYDEPLGFGTNPKGTAGDAIASVKVAAPFVMELANTHEAHRVPEFETYANVFGFKDSDRYYGAYRDGQFLGYAVVREHKTADYYHQAPTTERDRIQQHGLQPASPRINERWGDGPVNPAIGVYAEEGYPIDNDGMDPHELREESPWDKGDHANWDVWRIPHSQVADATSDPRGGETSYRINHPVQPELYQGGPETYGWDQRQAEVLMVQSAVQGQGAGTALLEHISAQYPEWYTHADTVAGERLLRRVGAVNVHKHRWSKGKGTEPKDMIEAPVPFVYDIPSDKLHLGYPGTSTHDVPGKISPGGLVEGTYEPGGAVKIWTYSTHPFSVRHLMDLWYHTAPQMEVTSLEQMGKDGKSTKLAASRVMYHSTNTPPDVIAQHGLRASTPWNEESGEERAHGVYLSDEPSDDYGLYSYAVNVDGLPMGYDPETSDEYVTQDIEPARIQRHASVPKEAPAVGPYIQSLLQSDVAASTAYKALRDAGGKVYAVGGAPRDALQGKIPNDIDLMVSGIPQPEVEHILNNLPGNATFAGKNFGVFHYHHGGDTVEIALPRSDDYGEGGRRADGKVTVDPDLPIADDLRRRDFTANATAVDLDTGELVDPHGGADDIKRGVLRTTHPDSFREDPSRLIRALTMHGRFGLTPDEQTRHEMGANAHLLRGESPDLLNSTFTKTLKSDNPASALRLAHETGILSHILPEVDDNWDFDQNNSHHRHTLGDHLMQVLDNTSRLTTDPDVRFAALLHDIGKPGSEWTDPDTGESHYYLGPDGQGANHEKLGAELAENRLRKGFNLQRSRINRITHLVSSHMFSPFTTPKGARRFIAKYGDEHADDLLNLREADQTGKGQTPEEVAARTSADTMRGLVNDSRVKGETTGINALAINGNDLMAMGAPQGPQVGAILTQLQNAVVDDPSLNDPAKLKPLAQSYIDAQPQ